MARRLSDAIFHSVCDLCTGVVRRALEIPGENDENEQANPRGFGEAVYDGLCATCTNACPTAFSRLAQHQTANQPEIALANIEEGVEATQVPTKAQIRAQQMDRILAYLNTNSPSPQVSSDGVEEASNPVPESGPSRSIEFSLGGDEGEPPVPAELVAAGITPVHIWQQLLPPPPPATQQRSENQRQNNPHWDRTDEYPFKYGRLQAHGERVRQWIESPESPGCYINPSTLTIEEFEANNRYLLAPRLHAVDEDFADQISGLGFELGRTHWSFQIRAPDFGWLGDTGPGVIIMKSVDRASEEAYPISEIARALYMRDFDIDTLQHVFFQNVQNVETAPFVRRALYTEENNLSWPMKAPQTWAYGTPEYDGLLGSRIGKIAGYLVLGAYPRGTRRITQIVTWAADPENHDRRIQIRFDIDFVPTA